MAVLFYPPGSSSWRLSSPDIAAPASPHDDDDDYDYPLLTTVITSQIILMPHILMMMMMMLILFLATVITLHISLPPRPLGWWTGFLRHSKFFFVKQGRPSVYDIIVNTQTDIMKLSCFAQSR